MKDEAQHLLDVLRDMLAPASASPTPQRLKLEQAMDALDREIKSDALDRLQQLGQEMDNG